MTEFLCGECIHNSDKGGGCLIPKNLGYVDNCNRYLPKDRPIVQTNEEWLRTATTEHLAEEVYKLVWCSNELFQQMECSGIDTKENDLKIVMRWLKQPHKDGES